jgi:hypothetical protein
LPFTSDFNPTGAACEEYFVGDGPDANGNRTGLWDREEQVPGVEVGDNIPSPPPADVVVPGAFFCWETNVLEFEDTDRSDGLSEILGSYNATHLQTLAHPGEYFATGWVALRFDQATADNVAGSTYTGLPVTGFAVQRYVNSTDASGARNYAGLFAHRYSKSITS